MPNGTQAAIALQTAARRYCVETHARWCAEYARIVDAGRDRENDGYHYTREARRTFPRYNVVAAILEAVERIDPESLSTVDDARDRLLAAASGDNAFTTAVDDNIQRAAILEEREAFTRFLAGVSDLDLSLVASLPYRRVLSAAESDRMWGDIRRRWKIEDGYWYPVSPSSVTGLIAIDAEAFRAAMPAPVLQKALQDRGLTRVWELREYGPSYQCDLSLFDPVYTGAEGYWSSAELDWIIYASHESSITIGGWLADSVKTSWPNWTDSTWGAAG
jgi:hypothetical protein